MCKILQQILDEGFVSTNQKFGGTKKYWEIFETHTETIVYAMPQDKIISRIYKSFPGAPVIR